MVNVAAVTRALGRLTLMKYFPAEDAARTALVEMVCGMIDHEDQAEWLAKRMLQIYREWPGPYEMRACFCSRYKPMDGINAYSEIYANGLPPDPSAPPRPEIAAPKLKALPAGYTKRLSMSNWKRAIQELAEKCKMPFAPHPLSDQFARMLHEIETAPPGRREPEELRPINLNFKRIDQSDVDRAVHELHERQAREGESRGTCGNGAGGPPANSGSVKSAPGRARRKLDDDHPSVGLGRDAPERHPDRLQGLPRGSHPKLAPASASGTAEQDAVVRQVLGLMAAVTRVSRKK